MKLRRIPKSMDRTAVAEVDARLISIAREHNVRVILAIESGSRAWGFPSPDSDYDCRFLFLRRVEDYLSLFPKRDVIETPIIGDMDVNGWDLAKALKLLLKGNSVVIEWLTSPIIYGGDAKLRDDMTRLASSVADRNLVARHYLHLGERQRRAYFTDDQSIALKKIFYALRPAAALRWLRLHPDMAVAPMHFPTLMKESDVPASVSEIISRLIEKKSETRELGKGPLPKVVGSFIDREFKAAKATFGDVRPRTRLDAYHRAEQFFLSALDRLAPE